MNKELKKVINEAFGKKPDMIINSIAEPNTYVIKYSLLVKSKLSFKKRIWTLLTNPLYYLFKGKWRI